MKLFHRQYGSGKPMVILHGLFGSSDNWMTQARMLSENFSVYTLDLRNHGLSPHDPIHTYEKMAEDVRMFVLSQAIGPVVLIGHSMGGKVAMLLACSHPELVEKLVVVDIVPKRYAPHHDQIIQGLKAMPLSTLSSRQEADLFLSNYVKDAGVRQFLLKNLNRDAQSGFSWKINLAVLAESMDEVLGNPLSGILFLGPSFFLFGSRSEYYKKGDEEIIRSFFPEAEIDFLETGHWVQAEKPEAFVARVKTFLN